MCILPHKHRISNCRDHRSRFRPNTEPHTILAPAKLNLFFEIHGKRPDGFHEITSLACPIDCYDTLTFEPTEDDVLDFDCSDGGTDVPTDETNIVVRALNLLKQETKTKCGAIVRLTKRIPSQAGLGGGSSDAVAALIVANRSWKLGLTPEELCRLAVTIGSDCPIFFQQGASISRGRGELIEPIELPSLHFVIIKPSEGLPTSAVYAECLKHHDGTVRQLESVLKPLKSGDLGEFGRQLFNRLESSAAALWNGYETTKRLFEQVDCLAVQMSGSGTAFFGLCRDDRHAERVTEKLNHVASKRLVFRARSLDHGNHRSSCKIDR